MSRRPMPTTEGEMEQFMREIAYSHPHILEALSTGNQEPLKQLLEERWPTHSRPAMGVDWLASREARHELTRCRSERCRRSKAEGAQLFVCSACQYARYCSRECQRHDWPQHKTICRRNQRAEKELRKALAASSSRPNSSPATVPASLFQELQALKRRLAPAFSVICMNAFLENSPRPGFLHGLDENIFFLCIERLPQSLITPTSQPWTRFRFRSVSVGPIDEMLSPAGQDEDSDILREERELTFEGDDKEKHGHITCVIGCPSFGGRISTVTTLIRVLKNQRVDRIVEKVDDWKEVMAQRVESVTGNKRSLRR